MLLVIYNPACGDKSGKDFVDAHVLPLLADAGRTPDAVVATDLGAPERHPAAIVRDALERAAPDDDVDVILASGDGTLNDIVSELSAHPATGPKAGEHFRLCLALVPVGTANAMYSSLFPPDSEAAVADPDYKLRSVRALLARAPTVPLTLAITTFSAAPAARVPPRASVSCVVTSTALHAAILHTAEAFRDEHPSLARFKLAAQQNATKWYAAQAKILPAAGSKYVQVYDPARRAFVRHPDSTKIDPIVDLVGPFIYFLSAINVDRLEPAFRIAPLAAARGQTVPSLDVVVIRPMTNHTITWDAPETREAFVDSIWKILTTAYQDGKHIDLRYNDAGEIVEGGDGEPVVEYFRCGGWEWLPDDIDDDAHIVCNDGAISRIDPGGRVVSVAARATSAGGFQIYA
ncbi:hypothetical protein HDZ31DRAFT_74967 [Schizophyllum fasciatum]